MFDLNKIVYWYGDVEVHAGAGRDKAWFEINKRFGSTECANTNLINENHINYLNKNLSIQNIDKATNVGSHE